ncbi:GntR family transcriptional regulator [Streptosporangiaceae bacterium NEAU-GS5]|nr:GntR family transcriptional regulator [Streptosporangiaceae bacterium NEAU-GS5]
MPEPLYRQVAARLRRRIAAGEWEAGKQLPSEPTLAYQENASRNTIRLAIALLTNEGLVESRQGRGTYIRERASFVVELSREEGALPGDGKDAFIAAVTKHGRDPAQRDFRMEIRTAPPEVAARLQIDEGADVVVRSVNRLIDKRPWSLQESFYPMAVAIGTRLMSAQNISDGTIAEMSRHGHIQTGYRDEIVARVPTHAEAAFLEIGGGVPVVELFRTAYSNERPIRLTITVYAGDSTVLAYDLGGLWAHGAGEGRNGDVAISDSDSAAQ